MIIKSLNLILKEMLQPLVSLTSWLLIVLLQITYKLYLFCFHSFNILFELLIFITTNLLYFIKFIVTKGIFFTVIFFIQLCLLLVFIFIKTITYTLKISLTLQYYLFKKAKKFKYTLNVQSKLAYYFTFNKIARLTLVKLFIKNSTKKLHFLIQKTKIFNQYLFIKNNSFNGASIKFSKHNNKFIAFYFKIKHELINVAYFIRNIFSLVIFVVKNLIKFISLFFKPANYITATTKLFEFIGIVIKVLTLYISKIIISEFENIIKIIKIDIIKVSSSLVIWLMLKTKFVFSWSLTHYFKAAFIYAIFIIIIINTSLFYNNYTLFTSLANKWQNTINVINTPYIATTLINKFNHNGSYRYQHNDVAVSNLNDLNNAFNTYNINKDQINNALLVIKKNYKFNDLKSSVTANIVLSSAKQHSYTNLLKLEIPINENYNLVIAPTANNSDVFTASTQKTEVINYIVKRDFVINNNYYAAANNSGIPKAIIAKVSYVLAWHVDFEREIKAGNIVEVLYECSYTNNIENPTCNNLLLVTIKLNDRNISIYQFNNKYYLSDGRSAATTLLRTPIDGARISSQFGKRVDPILGYTAFHKGIDFAAPTGTPIPASGDGTVVKIVVSNSYGKYVEIRHNAYLSTLYAHMNAFAKGLHIGETVTQRQIIGYAGATGWATGPHLHYEIHFNGNTVNPINVRLPSSLMLKGGDLEQFLLTKKQLDLLILKTPIQKKIFVTA